MLILSLLMLASSEEPAAARKPVEFFGRFDATAAFPLSEPQTLHFLPGFNSMISGGIDLGYVDFQLTAGLLHLAGQVGQRGTTSGGVGGGVRFKLPYHLYKYSWFADSNFMYWRTASLNRFAYSVGIGLLVPVKSEPRLKIGPVIRFMQVTNLNTADHDDRNAYVLTAGVSIEFGGARHPAY